VGFLVQWLRHPEVTRRANVPLPDNTPLSSPQAKWGRFAMAVATLPSHESALGYVAAVERFLNNVPATARWGKASLWVLSQARAKQMHSHNVQQMWAIGAKQARTPVEAAAHLMARFQSGDPVVKQFAEALLSNKCLNNSLYLDQYFDAPVQASLQDHGLQTPISSTLHPIPKGIPAVARLASLNICEKLASNEQALLKIASEAQYDISAIQETLHATSINVLGFFWLAPDCVVSDIPASRSPARGIGFLISNKFRRYVKVCKRSRVSKNETFWIQIQGKANCLDTYLCCAYVPGAHHTTVRCQSFFLYTC
jgi:hypothetical protein